MAEQPSVWIIEYRVLPDGSWRILDQKPYQHESSAQALCLRSRGANHDYRAVEYRRVERETKR